MTIRRRQFIALLGGAAVPWPLAAGAQPPGMPVIGFLNAGAPTAERLNLLAAFRQALSDAGYVEGRSVSIEYRWAENQYDRLPTMAADLVRRQVRVIATPGSTPAALAAKAATTTIPIVFSVGTDPVKAGLVASLNRPGSNVTGMSYLISLLVVKQLEQLHELAPNAAVMAVLLNPKLEAAASVLEDAQVAARALGLPIHVLYASTETDLDTVFASLTQLQAGGLVISADAFFFSRLEHLVGLATRYSVPTVYPWREAVAAGGLVSYGASVTDGYRLAGVYTGRILMGDKPADLPVQQSTKTELINAQTARMLSAIAPTLAGQANSLGVTVRLIDFKPGQLDATFADLVQRRPEALTIMSDAALYDLREPISALALKHHLPSIAYVPEFTDAGALMSYGPPRRAMYHRSASFVKRILAGVKPADLPVEQPTQVELSINLKTAKTIRVVIPDTVLARADRVIE